MVASLKGCIMIPRGRLVPSFVFLDEDILNNIFLWKCISVAVYQFPDHGANMGPILGRQDPDGPHVGAMNLTI